ncbi:MAG: hypothetical protein SNH94_04565 [Rikenellaceae bacterium]
MLPLRAILALGVVLLLPACAQRNSTAEVAEVNPVDWFTPARVELPVTDTVSYAQIYIVLRYTNIISTDSVEVVVTTTAPDGVTWNEPHAIHTPQGNHSIHMVESLYRSQVKWGQVGNYTVTFHPKQPYKGVSAVGVNVLYNK